MKRHLPLLLLLVLSGPAAAAERSFDYTRPAEGIAVVVVESGVGDVEIVGDASAGITARVEVSPKRTSIWGSRHSRDVDSLELEGEVRGSTLVLRLRPARHDERNFSENWSVRLPARLAAEVKLGVGEVKVLDVTGDIAVSAGVGDIRIESSFQSFGTIHATCGVGDATLRTPQGRNEGEGFIAHELHDKGPGERSIKVSAGVGDVTIRLR